MIILQCNGLEIVLTNDQIAKIDAFVGLVKQWNGLGLIAKSTVNEIYRWHIFDGLSIFNLLLRAAECEHHEASGKACDAAASCATALKESRSNLTYPILDFGAGGGVIGVPLSIIGLKNIILVERCSTKATFLRDIVHYPNVVENLQNVPKRCSFIARGVSSIVHVLDMTCNFDIEKIVFFKSNNYQKEIDDAKLRYDFHVEIYKRPYVNGVIVLITHATAR